MAEAHQRQDLSLGRLLMIGGHEDREQDKEVLTRFVEAAGGVGAPLVVITAASAAPDKLWHPYKTAFASMGVRDVTPLHFTSRSQAGYAWMAQAIERAGGVFISGGAQTRLLECLGDTPVHAALRRALARGACIAGTSAGASAMTECMLAEGLTSLRPVKGAVSLARGLGFIDKVVIDQHFSQRQRLARLLSAVAEHPHYFGLGIDEDTALLLGPGPVIEVLGAGGVTVIDPRGMQTNVTDIRQRRRIEIRDVRLHLLPAGARYALPGSDGEGVPAAPEHLHPFIRTITELRAPLQQPG